MASTVETPPADAPSKATNPRKRKKRTAAVGAANDCFTCANRNLPCDRGRPYCNRCLAAGEDCAGYKTQLTWGVGVASRGKLRGLSLPIAGTNKVAPSENPRAIKRRKESTNNPAEPAHSHFSTFSSTQAISSDPIVKTSPSTLRMNSTSYFRPPSPTSVPYSQFQHFAVNNSPHSQHFHTDVQRNLGHNHHHHSQSVRSPILPQPDQNTYSWRSSYPPVPNHFHQHHPHQNASPIPVDYTLSPISQPAHYVYDPVYASHGQEVGSSSYDGISMLIQAGQTVPVNNITPPATVSEVPEEIDETMEEITRDSIDDCAISDDLVIMPTAYTFGMSLPAPLLTNTNSIGHTPRMQYLINYYAEVISPVIVAFDRPNNPFRAQVLRLAGKSVTLQHAISALAASNLRQRRGADRSTGKTVPARRSSFAHVSLIDDTYHSQALLPPEEQAREETMHKRLAISQLNQQLANSKLRKDDSILATLLMLCLFHMCDSGIAKFQTQFAGVQRLLAIRGDELGLSSDESRWMSRMFVWFDALAATVNDREGQLSSEHLDLSPVNKEWSLETLTGIEARLFKTIQKLGRLNLLAQGKDVSAASDFMPSPFAAGLFTAGISADSLDGNGWFPPQQTELPPDHTSQFWIEWRRIREELECWILDTSSLESSGLTPDQQLDLENISQCFRFSALLYTERLSKPGVPSSHPEIQQWVQKALEHIVKVQSDVYLLWPLFITGSECVDEGGRDLIRGRCVDIQKDSGFSNNASCLELLEKVWKATSPVLGFKDEALEAGNGKSGNVFKFRDVMMREANEGEYIVV